MPVTSDETVVKRTRQTHKDTVNGRQPGPRAQSMKGAQCKLSKRELNSLQHHGNKNAFQGQCRHTPRAKERITASWSYASTNQPRWTESWMLWCHSEADLWSSESKMSLLHFILLDIWDFVKNSAWLLELRAKIQSNDLWTSKSVSQVKCNRIASRCPWDTMLLQIGWTWGHSDA